LRRTLAERKILIGLSKGNERRLRLKRAKEMNPCINCPLDSQGCHECGFADAKCSAWIEWKTNLLIFKAEAKLNSKEEKK